MHGPGVEAHLRKSSEAFDLCKRETFVRVVPKSKRREMSETPGVFDFNRISSGGAGAGRTRFNQLRCI